MGREERSIVGGANGNVERFVLGPSSYGRYQIGPPTEPDNLATLGGWRRRYDHVMGPSADKPVYEDRELFAEENELLRPNRCDEIGVLGLRRVVRNLDCDVLKRLAIRRELQVPV